MELLFMIGDIDQKTQESVDKALKISIGLAVIISCCFWFVASDLGINLFGGAGPTLMGYYLGFVVYFICWHFYYLLLKNTECVEKELEQSFTLKKWLIGTTIVAMAQCYFVLFNDFGSTKSLLLMYACIGGIVFILNKWKFVYK